MPAKCVVKLPDFLSFEQGASMMLKGMTVQYLLQRTLPQGGLQAGDHVLFHAAAGGRRTHRAASGRRRSGCG